MSSVQVDERLETAIMGNARELAVSVRLAFLIELQRHISSLYAQLAEEQESALASSSDVMDIITAHHRGEIDKGQVIDRLIDLTGWEEPEEQP